MRKGLPRDTEPSRRSHAARVAAIATVIVVIAYIVAVAALNMLVVQRLTAQADVRLTQRLAEVSSHSSVPSQPTGDSDHDIDDAPRFVWIVTGSGSAIALTPGSPRLPHRSWSPAAVTLGIDGTPFRLLAVHSGDGWLVAGESLEQLSRVQSALLTPELVFGLVLTVVTFIGALIIGLRASAPLELIHRRQVEFTADASHELRTPLSVIEAEVDLALSRPRRPDEYEKVLHRIAGEGHRLQRIVNDLLWLARMDDEQMAIDQVEEVDVGALANDLVERFQPIASARGVSLSVQGGGSTSGTVRTDPRWMDRLLGVLIDNACKFAGDRGQVVVSVRTAGNRVALTVDDSGPGIPPEQRPLVLDRFHRGADGPGGAGLGLAIADSVVRATHGTWLIGDSPLGGARMEVTWKRGTNVRARPAGPTLGDGQRGNSLPASPSTVNMPP
jgi:two-component system, OmpR family, sensor histidine kinase CiaH